MSWDDINRGRVKALLTEWQDWRYFYEHCFHNPGIIGEDVPQKYPCIVFHDEFFGENWIGDIWEFIYPEDFNVKPDEELFTVIERLNLDVKI